MLNHPIGEKFFDGIQDHDSCNFCPSLIPVPRVRPPFVSELYPATGPLFFHRGSDCCNDGWSQMLCVTAAGNFALLPHHLNCCGKLRINFDYANFDSELKRIQLLEGV